MLGASRSCRAGAGEGDLLRTSSEREPLKKTKVAVIRSGNIGTDLLNKGLRPSPVLEMAAMVGIAPGSDGLARAARLGVPTTAEGLDGLLAMEGFDEIGDHLRRDVGYGARGQRRR